MSRTIGFRCYCEHGPGSPIHAGRWTGTTLCGKDTGPMSPMDHGFLSASIGRHHCADCAAALEMSTVSVPVRDLSLATGTIKIIRAIVEMLVP